MNLGLIYLRANEFAKAADEFRNAAEREPETPEDRSLLIYALGKAGKNEEADEEKSGKRKQVAAQSESRKSSDPTGDGARPSNVRTIAANGG